MAVGVPRETDDLGHYRLFGLGPGEYYLTATLKEADEELSRTMVSPDSKAVGTTIGEANVETETGNRIIAVRRRKTWIYGPGRRFALQAGDTLIFRGRGEGAKRLRAWAEGREDRL